MWFVGNKTIYLLKLEQVFAVGDEMAGVGSILLSKMNLRSLWAAIKGTVPYR